MPQYLEPNEFVSATPHLVVDVRTPAEFEAGHLPHAVNIPLFTNQQRAVVGTLYKQKGKHEAITQGLAFVGPHLAEWVVQVRALAAGRKVHVHCWRGGMRSSSMAWLFETAGIPCAVLKGGYKAYRQAFGALLQQHPWQFAVVAGPTGCGKTAILDELEAQGEQVLPLEALACHKGSAFGALGQAAQPTNEQFENELHRVLRGFTPLRPVWVEGESKTIGRNFIPQLLFDRLQQAITFEIQLPQEPRLDRLVKEYAGYPTEELETAFVKISKRLGGLRTTQALEFIHANQFREAAQIALQYYDKSYAYTLGQRPGQAIQIALATDQPEQTARLLRQTLALHLTHPMPYGNS